MDTLCKYHQWLKWVDETLVQVPQLAQNFQVGVDVFETLVQLCRKAYKSRL